MSPFYLVDIVSDAEGTVSPGTKSYHTLDLKLTLEDLGRSLSSPGRGTSFASIAVLPFINMNRDEENEFLSDGITEDIINALMGVAGLRVAAREAEHSIELVPLVPINYGGLITMALWRRQYDLAQAVTRKVMELEPDFGLGLCGMGLVLCQQGEYKEAVAVMQHACRIQAPGGFWGPGLLGYCYARWGRQEEARRVLADLETLCEGSYAQAIALAAVHAGLGEKDRALDWLERAFEEHCGGLAWVRNDPVWDGLREEPRFQALLGKMNLAG